MLKFAAGWWLAVVVLSWWHWRSLAEPVQNLQRCNATLRMVTASQRADLNDFLQIVVRD